MNALMCQRIGMSDEAIDRDPAQVRQWNRKNKKLVRTRKRQLKGTLSRRAVIDIAVAKRGQRFADHPSERQALLGEEDAGRSGVGR